MMIYPNGHVPRAVVIAFDHAGWPIVIEERREVDAADRRATRRRADDLIAREEVARVEVKR